MISLARGKNLDAKMLELLPYKKYKLRSKSLWGTRCM